MSQSTDLTEAFVALRTQLLQRYDQTQAITQRFVQRATLDVQRQNAQVISLITVTADSLAAIEAQTADIDRRLIAIENALRLPRHN